MPGESIRGERGFPGQKGDTGREGRPGKDGVVGNHYSKYLIKLVNPDIPQDPTALSPTSGVGNFILCYSTTDEKEIGAISIKCDNYNDPGSLIMNFLFNGGLPDRIFVSTVGLNSTTLPLSVSTTMGNISINLNNDYESYVADGAEFYVHIRWK